MLVPLFTFVYESFVGVIDLRTRMLETYALCSQSGSRTSINFSFDSSGSALWRSGCHLRALEAKEGEEAYRRSWRKELTSFL